MDLSLAFHSHSDHVAERGPWVDRSMVVSVVDVGVAGVDYGKADIQHSELVDSEMVALVDELEQLAWVFEQVHSGLSGSFHGTIPLSANHYLSADDHFCNCKNGTYSAHFAGRGVVQNHG
jgi:hypothetical protein